MLTMLKHGCYSIEDPTGSLDLDLSETKFSRGLYTENNFILAQGWYEDRTFHVAALGWYMILNICSSISGKNNSIFILELFDSD